MSSTREEIKIILALPFEKSAQAAIDKFLGQEHLNGHNERFCDSCGRKCEAIKETEIVACADIFVLSIKDFGLPLMDAKESMIG